MTWILCKKTVEISSQVSGIAQSVIDGDIVEMHDFDRWADGGYRIDFYKVETVGFEMSEINEAVNILMEEIYGD